MNTKTAKTRILAGEFDAALSRLYGDARVPAQRIRYANAVASFEQLYGDRDVAFFSVPGRTSLMSTSNFGVPLDTVNVAVFDSLEL